MATTAFVTPTPVLRASTWLATPPPAAAGLNGRPAVRMATSPPPPASKSSGMSRSVPFLSRPPALDGSLPADAGFDPLGFTTRIDRRWMVEGELKHGRVAMLAVVGMLVQEFVQLPNHLYANPLPSGAWADVPALALWQIFAFCGLFEMATYGGCLNYPMMLEWFDEHPERVGGTFGLDFAKLMGPPGGEKERRLRTSEIKNGRLAMLAAGGMVTQTVLFQTPVIAQLLHFKPMDVPGL